MSQSGREIPYRTGWRLSRSGNHTAGNSTRMLWPPFRFPLPISQHRATPGSLKYAAPLANVGRSGTSDRRIGCGAPAPADAVRTRTDSSPGSRSFLPIAAPRVCEAPAVCRPRHPERFTFYQVLEGHFDGYVRICEERFEARCGPLRRVVVHRADQIESTSRGQENWREARSRDIQGHGNPTVRPVELIPARRMPSNLRPCNGGSVQAAGTFRAKGSAGGRTN